MRQILLYIFILFVCSVSAEQFMITGTVVDARDSLQCIGASVMVVGTNRGTATDGDGNFSIEVEKGEILKFSYYGYNSKEVEVLNDSSLVIEMKAWKEFCYCSEYGRHIITSSSHGEYILISSAELFTVGNLSCCFLLRLCFFEFLNLILADLDLDTPLAVRIFHIFD